ncbi:cytochrome c oxidase subunit II [Halieaceae bacterium IMCC14734]|uniref:Cytochrome c oxidase subunit 2 n=1 Tax=Candidatus Litorirhabdus singularis TaxID=2518993 RepID=A0ABT3TDN9_9GAMM|nr:cytochrome c oxidase subunit II [Candidatus Litorirhabdus singularis]MCX2979940.1 cytochrome c oxidase subunit II [Candidatus Litorirhabdus singularis]
MCFKAKRRLTLALSSMSALLPLTAATAWAQDSKVNAINMPVGVTEVSASIYDLHMIIFWICVIIGVLVFGVMFYSIFAHRKSKGVVPATFHESTKVEIAWTVVPFLILLAMAVPATKTLIEIYDFDDAEMDILVTGFQWKWKYEYLQEDGENLKFFSNLRTPQDEIYNEEVKGEHYLLEVDEPLVVPVDTKVRLLVTANDVIHSWWVPDLAVKKDAIPGFINETWFKSTQVGIFRGQCAELCGKEHGFMPIVVHVVSKADYVDWLATKQSEAAEIKELMAQSFTLDELAERGKGVYQRSCLACHGANGEGGVGKAIAGSLLVTGAINGHLDSVVNGVPGTAMQAFGGQLNDVDMAAVITYQRNAFGNNMGDMVQPLDIFNFKKGQ